MTNKLGKLPGELAPNFDIVGPTVEADVRRIINRYGAAVVKAAVKTMTMAPRGRRKINDWRDLVDVMREDAHEWLNGGDPFSSRTDYSIAKRFAERNPGQSAISTHQRIERKLRKAPYNRRWYMLVTAEGMSHDKNAWKLHVRALEELARIDTHTMWSIRLKRINSEVSDYTAKWGSPSDEMTMKEVEEGARKSVPGILGLAPPDLDSISLFGRILWDAARESK